MTLDSSVNRVRRTMSVVLLLCLGLVGTWFSPGAALAQDQEFLGFSSNGTVLGVGIRGSLRFLDANSGRLLWSIQDYGLVAFLPPDRVIVQAKKSPLQVREAATGKVLLTLSGPVDLIEPMAIRPDGLVLAAAAKGGVVHVWDLKTAKLVQTLKTGAGQIWALEVSADRRSLAVRIAVRQRQENVWRVQLWDLVNRRVRRVIVDAYGLRFSRDGRSLYTWRGLYDGLIREWSLQTAQLRRVLNIHEPCAVDDVGFWASQVYAVAYAGCSDLFVVGVDWFDARTFKRLGGVSDSQRDGGFRLTNTPWMVLFPLREGTAVSVTDVRTNRARMFRDDNANSFSLYWAVALSPGGRLIGAIIDGRVLSVWDVSSEKLKFSVGK